MANYSQRIRLNRSEKGPGRRTSDAPTEAAGPYRRLNGDLGTTAWTAATSKVAVFRVRWSGIVASELLLRGPGDGTDEGKGAGLQGTEVLGNAHDFIQTIISQERLPISNLPTYGACWERSI